MRKASEFTGDPLIDFPQFAEVITPRLRDWRENRLCLCGCGQQTRIAVAHAMRGQPGYFKPGHCHRLYRQSGLLSPIETVDKTAGNRKRWNQACITTLGISQELKDYCMANNITMKDLASQSGIPKSYLYEISSRSRKRITKRSLIRIMEAMNLEVHASLRSGRSYRDCLWCGATFLAAPHGKTCSRKCRGDRNDWQRLGGKSAADLELAREYGV